MSEQLGKSLLSSKDSIEYVQRNRIKVVRDQASPMIADISTSCTVKSRAVDQSTIEFWNFLAKGQSTEASNFPFICRLKI